MASAGTSQGYRGRSFGCQSLESKSESSIESMVRVCRNSLDLPSRYLYHLYSSSCYSLFPALPSRSSSSYANHHSSLPFHVLHSQRHAINSDGHDWRIQKSSRNRRFNHGRKSNLVGSIRKTRFFPSIYSLSTDHRFFRNCSSTIEMVWICRIKDKTVRFQIGIDTNSPLCSTFCQRFRSGLRMWEWWRG